MPQRLRTCLWLLVAIYALARITQAYPDRIPIVWIVALHVLPPLAFAILHGTAIYRLRGILTFVLLCLLIGNTSEILGVRTGIPFGHYHFTAVMGPKLFQVPILLGWAYVGIGYLAWTLAGIILARSPLIARPLLAAAIMTAWDLSMDPIWANLVDAWVWENGGAYFGVPLSNFFGWYLTNYLIYQSFALAVRPRSDFTANLPAEFWSSAVAFYAVTAAGNLLVIPPRGLDVVHDPTGATWSAAEMLRASMLVSIFIMGGFTALAAWRVYKAPARKARLSHRSQIA